MIIKILEKELGQVTHQELQFARQQMKNEKEMKGLALQRGERLDLLALYILFHRRHLQ